MSLTNVGLTDRTAIKLADALEKNNTVRVVNVETNFISPTVIVRLIKSLLKMKIVEEFRASNQVQYSYFVNQLSLNSFQLTLKKYLSWVVSVKCF